MEESQAASRFAIGSVWAKKSHRTGVWAFKNSPIEVVGLRWGARAGEWSVVATSGDIGVRCRHNGPLSGPCAPPQPHNLDGGIFEGPYTGAMTLLRPYASNRES